MNARTWKRMAGVAAAMVLAAFGPGGCNKDDPNTSELDGYFDSHPLVNDPRNSRGSDVSISPDSAVVSSIGGTVAFRASGGRSPYTWDVANGAVGSVSGSGADEGIYRANSVGNNNVIVYDADQNAAVASISGTASSSSSTNAAAALAVTPAEATLSADGALVVLKATGGQPPYSWTIGNSARGWFQGSLTATGASVIYERHGSSTVGDNSVTVTDNLGATASAIIHQP